MKKPLLLAALAATSATVSAQVLMFDFGPTAATGTSLTNSPYHTVNNGFTGSGASTWNNITADSSSLAYSNGSAATGISINIGGTNTGDLNSIALSPTNATSSSALAGQTTAGVYSGTSVGRDAIFQTVTNTVSLKTGAVGVQIAGLAAGTYDIYLTGRNTSINFTTGPGTETITAYAGVGVVGSDFTFTSYTATGGNSFTSVNGFTTSWVQGENYIKFTISLLGGQALNIATTGAGSTAGNNDQRGFINSLQIVPSAIPEPSSYAAVVGALAVSAAALRRRRRA